MRNLQSLADDWPLIDALLDDALALPAEQRDRWLDALPPLQAALKDTLRQLLSSQARVAASDFLSTLPRLQGLLADAVPPLAGGREAQAGDTVGPYRLSSLLGQGGMGTVWLAERADGGVRRTVALKLPRLGWDGATAGRLAREAEILAALEHPHIARLYEAGTDALGRPFLVWNTCRGSASTTGAGRVRCRFAAAWTCCCRCARPSPTRTAASSSTAT